MNKYYQKLELDKVLELVANSAYSDLCKEKILALQPIMKIEKIQQEINKTGDAFDLSSKFGTPRFQNIKDITPSLKRCVAGSSLSLKELLDIGDILRVASGLINWYKQGEGIETSLTPYFQRLVVENHLEHKIFNSIISEEELSDNASSELASIRRRIQRQGSKIREQLNKIVKSQHNQKYLQESLITMRDGRYVVPVKAEYRGEISGLVHDSSASGSTLFIEPMSVVEANNEVRILQGQEQQEIIRIIRELSQLVAQSADDLRLNLQTIIQLECYFVKSNFGGKTNSFIPVISEKPEIFLDKARHPLIEKDKVVPISLSLGRGFNCLIVTGPNTGGKTVAIKTAGLLTLMAMCGLMIPAAEGSVIGTFSNILVDIGDEQSIEQSLSTFSSHMTNIISILDRADENSLVLLDELGSGTDPVEGAALAVSILTHLKNRGCKVVATTHYQEVKIFALETDGVENASCEFDVNTLKPTFKLIIGIPGKSNAFAISTRLGMKGEIIDYANNLISNEDKKFEQVIETLENSRQEVEKLKRNLELENGRSRAIREDLAKQLSQLEQEKEKELESARRTALSMVEEIKTKSNMLMNELEEIKKAKDKEGFSSKFNQGKSQINRQLNRLYDVANPVMARKSDNYKLPRKLRLGDDVLLADINKKGNVITLPNASGDCLVQVGIIKIKTNVSNIRLVEEEVSKGKNPPKHGNVSKKVTSNMERKSSVEVDIRGMNCDEGIYEVDKFIDNGLMGGMAFITIIHGKGTGVLRKAIHEYLRTHPSVKGYRLGEYGEGDAGVTVAQLK